MFDFVKPFPHTSERCECALAWTLKLAVSSCDVRATHDDFSQENQKHSPNQHVSSKLAKHVSDISVSVMFNVIQGGVLL